MLRLEGSPNLYDVHLCCEYEYTGPYKKTSEPVTKPSPVTNKKVHRKYLAGKDEKVEATTSSDNEGSSERPVKKPRNASSASVMHVQPLHSDDDDHNMLLSTLTGGHGVFMAKAEVKIEDWYDPDNGWSNSGSNWQAQGPLFNLHADPSTTGGKGALLFDSSVKHIQAKGFQIVDSGATTHFVPVYYTNDIPVPVLPYVSVIDIAVPVLPYVPVIDIDDFLFDDDEEDDDEEDDDESLELPPGGPVASTASEAPLPPNVSVLDLDEFLLGVDVPAQVLPDAPALNLDPELGLGATDDLAGSLTMLSMSYGLRFSPKQMMDRIQFQHVPPYVSLSNGTLEHRHSELVSQERQDLNGRVYMVYGASAAATASRHSRPESFNDIARQYIGRPDRIL